MNILKLMCFTYFLSLVFLGCSPEEVKEMKPEMLSTIEVDDLISILPNNLVIGKNVIFVNSLGDEKTLLTSFETGYGQNVVNGDEYTQEKFSIRYSEPADPNLEMFLRGAGYYDPADYTIQKIINAVLMPTSVEGSCRITLSLVNDEFTSWSEFQETLTLFGNTFSNVFIGRNDFNTFNRYTQVMMNRELGIMSYKDENDELWVFDRFE